MARNRQMKLPDGALGEFEGRAVLGRAVKLTNTGDGLSKAMKVQPRELQIGDEVFFTGRGTVVSAELDPIKDTEALLRIDVVKAGTLAFVDETVVIELLDAQERLLDEINGTPRLPFDVDGLVARHEAGEHADGLVGGCPSCQAEIDAAEHEAKPRRRRAR